MIELNIIKKIEAETGIVYLEGDLDQPNANNFFESMVTMIKENKLITIILELNNLTFLDSLGLGAIIRLQTQLQESNGCLKLVCAKEAVLKVFELSGLWSPGKTDNRLELFETYELAKQH